jgi:hypothetical protein
MKKMSLVGSLLVLSSIAFVGCADKIECGVDGCGKSYVDKTYRTYTNNCDTCKTKKEVKKVCTPCEKKQDLISAVKKAPVLEKNKPMRITVIGQGVAPCNGGCSPAQSYALAKRAAIADSYRQIAEKVKGVYVEGQDLVQNMMVKRSTVRTSVSAMVRNANIVETNFKDGLCEVEMEIVIYHSQFQ